jgi:para-aminobenzoate synthetase component I
MKSSAAISIMNRYGKQFIPFIFIIDFEMKAPLVIALEKAKDQNIFYKINGFTNIPAGSLTPKQVKFKRYPISFRKYSASFDKVLRHINAGNTYLLNLTFPTPIETNLSLQEIFFLSRAKYKLLLKNKFVVFSPESFIQIHGRTISSYPMKGTIVASIPKARSIILSDKKESAEHNTIVDLIRNDLSRIAKRVRVKRFRFIDKIKTNIKDLLQVSSEITGTLPANFRERIGDIIFEMLPAGSVSGAPKKKTVEIIREVETYERGYYTGVFGYFDGKTLDSGVMIRFIERVDKKLIYKSGGGITSFSDANSEYHEMIDKVYVPIV